MTLQDFYTVYEVPVFKRYTQIKVLEENLKGPIGMPKALMTASIR